jgi:NAD(P)-dependent dehydrogenase (short-subunit alcohol dehydrogenase family)
VGQRSIEFYHRRATAAWSAPRFRALIPSVDVRDLSGKAIVVTGAGSGIGRATALLAAQRHAKLYLCDVNEGGLAETAAEAQTLGAAAHTSRVDVADPEAMRAFADRVHADVEAVDVLVNNAGVALGATFTETTLEDWRWIVGINLLGPIHGCHFFLPHMIERGRGGHVVNVASMAGFLPSEGTVAYGTTKFGVVGLSEYLRVEVGRRGIGVTAICPGMINTPIVRAARGRGAYDTSGFRSWMGDTFRRRNYGPERVAKAIFRAIQRDLAIVPVSPEAWAFYLLKRASPAFTHRLSRWVTARLRRDLAIDD